MSADSLDRLTIDKTRQITSKGRSRRLRGIIIAAVVLAAVIAGMILRTRSISIETTNVNQVYPTQSFTLLNASGYVVAALIVFRLVWGLVGSRYARFAEFVRGPAAIREYLSGMLRLRPPHYTGHNPAGALAVGIVVHERGLIEEDLADPLDLLDRLDQGAVYRDL